MLLSKAVLSVDEENVWNYGSQNALLEIHIDSLKTPYFIHMLNSMVW